MVCSGVRLQSDEGWFEGKESGTVGKGVSFKKFGNQRVGK